MTKSFPSGSKKFKSFIVHTLQVQNGVVQTFKIQDRFPQKFVANFGFPASVVPRENKAPFYHFLTTFRRQYTIFSKAKQDVTFTKDWIWTRLL
jgi:hypothetical protein